MPHLLASIYRVLTFRSITELPSCIGNMTNLTALRLDGVPEFGNKIVSLPPEIGRLVRLRDLRLSNNALLTLPVR